MRGRLNISTRITWLPLVVTILFSTLTEAQIVNISTQADESQACEEDMEIIPTCLLKRVVATTPQELITNDLKVCTCLNQSNHLFKNYIAKPSTDEQINSEKKRLLDNAAQRTGNLSVLQSSSVAENGRDIELAVLTYGGQEARKLTKSQRKPERGTPIPELSRNITKINEIDEENSSWQCVTYQEYSVQREIPSENEFFLLLKNTESFIANDWDVNQLRSRYDAASDEEKVKIQLKLTFLSRNPIFQAIFKASPSERFSAELISKKQSDLFSILQSLKPASNSTCHTVPNGCWQEIHRTGAFGNYTSQVRDFVTNDNVIDIASAQSAQEYQAELQRIMNEGEVLIDSVPTDPEGYFRYLQTANSEIATSCSGSTTDPSCYTKFQKHCSNISKIDQRVRKGLKRNADDISAELIEDASIHARMDVQQNPLFRRFNDSICQQPFQNAAGENLTFFQYREKHCQGQNQLSECSDRQRLLSRYLLEHNNGGSVEDQNLRAGFANLVGDAEYIAVSEVQVAAANNISESPAELRARFGNRLPSISASGQLIPATVSGLAQGNSNPLNNSAGAGSIDSVSSNESTSSSTSSSGNSSSSGATDVRPIKKTSLQLPDTSKFDDLYKSLMSNPVAKNTGVKDSSVFNEAIDQIQNNVSVTPESSRFSNNSFNQAKQSVRASVEKDAVLVSNNQRGGSGAVTKQSNSGNDSAPSIRGSSNSGGASLGPSRAPSSTKGLFFKYNLDREGNEIRPELAIVSARTSSEVKVEIPRRQLERIKANPNSLILEESDLNEIFSSPDKEVKLILETENGESLVVYAKKDGSGGVSFGLKPSEAQVSRGPASSNNIVRIEVNKDMYKNVSENPDVFLNQNDVLIQEIKKQESEDLILQVVSPGEKARSYKVKKLYENIYQFQEIKN